jgi:hypothetical protein
MNVKTLHFTFAYLLPLLGHRPPTRFPGIQLERKALDRDAWRLTLKH